MAGVRIKDLNKTIRLLKKYGDDATGGALKELMFTIGTKAANDAKALTPARTGALRNSIRASKTQNKATVRAGSKRVNYASFNEWGSVHNTAVGMVQKAVKNNEGYAVRTLDRGMQSLAKRYGL